MSHSRRQIRPPVPWWLVGVIPEGQAEIGAQKFHRLLWSYGIGRKRRIRNDCHERGLGERAGCPALLGIPVEPMLRGQVSFMGMPQQRDQDIHV